MGGVDEYGAHHQLRNAPARSNGEVQVGFDLSVPFTVALVAGVLVLIMRWVFKPSRPRTGRPHSGPGADLGMLTPVVNHGARSAALAAKDRLSRQGIRCSLSRISSNCYDVLVFMPDADRATALLAD